MEEGARKTDQILAGIRSRLRHLHLPLLALHALQQKAVHDHLRVHQPLLMFNCAIAVYAGRRHSAQEVPPGEGQHYEGSAADELAWAEPSGRVHPAATGGGHHGRLD